jgi:undecaprenyl-diphosphatase
MQLLFPVGRRSLTPASRGPARSVFARALRFLEERVGSFYTAVVLSILFAFLVGIAAVVLFVFIGDVVTAGATREIDEAVLRWAAERRTPALDDAMLEITALGSTLVLAIVAGTAAVFLWLTRHRFSVYILAAAFFAAIVLNIVLKALYGRPRPDDVPAIVTSQSPAFPSGHALSAFAIYGTLAYLVARLEPSPRLRAATWIIAALIILAVGASRVYLGVHYPSDVIAGFAIALAWIAFTATAVTAVTYLAQRRPRSRQ